MTQYLEIVKSVSPFLRERKKPPPFSTYFPLSNRKCISFLIYLFLFSFLFFNIYNLTPHSNSLYTSVLMSVCLQVTPFSKSSAPTKPTLIRITNCPYLTKELDGRMEMG